MPNPLLPRILQNMAYHCCAEQDTVKTRLQMIVFLCFPQEERNVTCLSDWHNHKRTQISFKTTVPASLSGISTHIFLFSNS